MIAATNVIAAKLVLGTGLALGLALAPYGLAVPDVAVTHGTFASLEPAPGYDAYAVEAGDDNEDGVIEEDESGWDCPTMGNRICGPGNSNGVPAGQYDEGGVLVAWPHEYVPSWCKDICLGA
jgi:hypothetical protein